MSVDQDHSPELKDVCYIVKRPGLPGGGWDVTGPQGEKLLYALELWPLVMASFQGGFDVITVKDGIKLYRLTIVQID